MNKKEIATCEFELDFKKAFCWCSNLSSDDIISWRPGLKRGMDLRGHYLKRV